MRQIHSGLGFVLNPMTSILIRDREEDTQRHTERHKAKGHVMTVAEIGLTQLQAKKHQGLVAATRSLEGGMEQMLPWSLQKEPSLLTPLISHLWTSEI